MRSVEARVLGLVSHPKQAHFVVANLLIVAGTRSGSTPAAVDLFPLGFPHRRRSISQFEPDRINERINRDSIVVDANGSERITLLLTLYRGISVDAERSEDVKARILSEGIIGTEGKWRAEYFDLKLYLKELLEREDLSVDLTRPNEYARRTEIVFGGTTVPTTNGIYACGEQNGASFYAERDHGSNQIGLVIEFSVPVSDVLVDGRDFLYNAVFQASALSESQRTLVRKVFGARMDHYIDRAFRFEDVSQRIAVCDLAVQDPKVIREHHRNRLTIQGRYKTRFCSAFLVKVPIPPARIHGIRNSQFELKTPDLSIETFRYL